MYALYTVLRSLNNFQNGKAQFQNTGDDFWTKTQLRIAQII